MGHTRVRHVLLLTVFGLCAGCNGVDLGGGDTPASGAYDLSRRPAFRPGDVVYWSTVRETETLVQTTDGQVVRDRHSRTTGQMAQVVLAVDEAGRPTRLRMRASDVARDVSSSRPRSAAFADTIRFETVMGEARREGGQFKCDPSTLASADMPAPSAGQIALMKDVLLGPRRFQGWSADTAALMPSGPVAIGGTWQPPAAALRAWSPGPNWTVRAAQLKLTAVRDGVADVQGRFELAAETGDREVTAQATKRWLIDTETGVWLNESSTTEARTRSGGFARVHRLSANKAVRVHRGEGRAPARPDGLHDVGWSPAGPDTNNHRDTEQGWSLDLPAGCSEVDNGSARTAAFECEDGIRVEVRKQAVSRPVEPAARLADMRRRIGESLEGFTPGEEQRLLLAGGVPAALMEGSFLRGGRKRALVALVAVDGGRMAAVTLAGPDSADARKRMRSTARSLRLFAPTPSPGAAADAP